MNGAKEALDQSKNFYEDMKYKDSILSSEESVRLSNEVLGAMKESANSKIAGAESKYMQAKESEGAAIAVDQLNGAKNALDLSRSFYNESKFKDSIASAEESERLSDIVLNTRKKGGEGALIGSKDKDAAMSEEDYIIYKVRYIPERRDCLWRIAEKFYENPWLWKNIYKANTDKIYDPDLIWPDMFLKVPRLKGTPTQKKEKPEQSSTPKEPVS